MKALTHSLKKAAPNIAELPLDKVEWFLRETFEKREMSVPAIAKLCGTYPNKIRRLLQKCSFETRTRSQAQSLALKQGRHPHPTKGTKRPEATKIAISETASNTWANLTTEEREKRSEIGRELWNAMTEHEQQLLRDKANVAIRLAAIEGSKLEKFLLQELMKAGYKVLFHKEHMVISSKLHIDLLLPVLRVAIEVDGPSHFEPVWGFDVLKKTQATDLKKDGLLLDAGYCVVRVQQRKGLSDKYKRDIWKRLLETITDIKTKFPVRAKRHITIGEF